MDENEFPPLGAEVVKKKVEVKVDVSDTESVVLQNDVSSEKHEIRKSMRERDSESSDEEYEWRIIVLDTSALLWAPQGVRKLVRQGWEVVIPSEGWFAV